MSKYVLTQEQLDHLQQQIQQLTKLNDTKQERINVLELHKVRVSSTETADLIKTIGELENELGDISRAKERLKTELNSSAERAKRLKMMLEEEQRLRKSSEMYAKEMEVKHAEESLIRELTTELCQLQRAELDIDNKRIQELQQKLNKFIYETGYPREHESKERKHIINTKSKENFLKDKQLKLIIEQLRSQLFNLHNFIENIPVKTREHSKSLEEIGKWLRETSLIIEDINDVENLRKELKYMRQEIDSKRKSISQ